VNCGCWDVTYIKGDPCQTNHYWGPDAELREMQPLKRGSAIRARGFRVRTPILEYESNLRKILTYLKSTGATVIFPLSTPCPTYQNDDRCGLLRAYNEIAQGVCRELNVKTVDLYAVGEKFYDHQPDRCHYDAEGNDALATEIEKAVREALLEREGKR